MADRVPIYELHIRPLFRVIDRAHMALFFDLGDHDALQGHAQKILLRLRHGMPPESTGGPWPPELITMFERWVNAGCPRLTVGTGSQFQFTKSGTSYHLECVVQVPNDTTQCWLDIVDVDPAHRSYRIYVQPNSAPAAPTPVTVSDDFDETASITSVTVFDGAGTQTIPVTDQG
jgi:hypothetical protein